MKQMYSLEIRKIGTHEYRKREILLTEDQAQKLEAKLRKPENGYMLVSIYPVRERE
jgi:hypothetical protein